MSFSVLHSDCHSQQLLLAVISCQNVRDVQNVTSAGHLCRSCDTAAPSTALWALIGSSNFAVIKRYGISVHYIKRKACYLYIYIYFISNATTCLSWPPWSPSRLWPKCNRLLRLGRPQGAVTLS
jgi:hypothetical protein